MGLEVIVVPTPFNKDYYDVSIESNGSVTKLTLEKSEVRKMIGVMDNAIL